jgi:hypothetical protein
MKPERKQEDRGVEDVAAELAGECAAPLVERQSARALGHLTQPFRPSLRRDRPVVAEHAW